MPQLALLNAKHHPCRVTIHVECDPLDAESPYLLTATINALDYSILSSASAELTGVECDLLPGAVEACLWEFMFGNGHQLAGVLHKVKRQARAHARQYADR